MVILKTLAVLYRYMIVVLSTLIVVKRYKYRDGYSLLSCLYYDCYFVFPDVVLSIHRTIEVSLTPLGSVLTPRTMVRQNQFPRRG